jgi:hypothetical protein
MAQRATLARHAQAAKKLVHLDWQDSERIQALRDWCEANSIEVTG